MESIVCQCVNDYRTEPWSEWWENYWTLVGLTHQPKLVRKDTPDSEKAKVCVGRLRIILAKYELNASFCKQDKMESILHKCVQDHRTKTFPEWWKDYWTLIGLMTHPNSVWRDIPDNTLTDSCIERIRMILGMFPSRTIKNNYP